MLLATRSEGLGSNQFFYSVVILTVFSTLAVTLRFWSRAVGQKGQYGWDDWTCLAALFFSYALYGCTIATTIFGLSPNADSKPNEHGVTVYKLVAVSFFLFGASIGLVKTSALCFYTRIFRGGHGPSFRHALYAGHALVGAWFIFFIIGVAVNLVPMGDGYNALKISCCHIGLALYLSTAVVDTFTDVYILLLPVPTLWALNMRNKKKALIIGAFLLGYVTLVLSLGRLIVTVNIKTSGTPSANITSIFKWALLEPGLGVISICVPSSWHLYQRLRAHGIRSLFTSRDYSRDESQVMAAAAAAREREQQEAANSPAGAKPKKPRKRPAHPLFDRLTSILRETERGTMLSSGEFDEEMGGAAGRRERAGEQQMSQVSEESERWVSSQQEQQEQQRDWPLRAQIVRTVGYSVTAQEGSMDREGARVGNGVTSVARIDTGAGDGLGVGGGDGGEHPLRAGRRGMMGHARFPSAVSSGNRSVDASPADERRVRDLV